MFEIDYLATAKLISGFWPLFVLLGAFLMIQIFFTNILPREIEDFKTMLRFKKGKQWRSNRNLLQWIRGMSPTEFEQYIAELFRQLGYETRTVGGPGDGGIDVVAEKDGIKQYIQCKKYFNRREVGVEEMREFYGTLADRLNNGKAFFVTTSKFTLAAEKYAQDKPIELVDSERLIQYIRLANPDSKSASQEKKCSQCAGALVERKGKYGSFFGCSNYPECRYTTSITELT